MRGRAGRAGRDTYGESFIVCREKELPEVRTLLSTAMPSVSSCLATSTGAAGLSRALLEVITIRLATSPFSIEEYFHSTLLYHLRADEELPKLLSDSLKELESLKLIQDEGDGFWSATKVGEATVAAGLSPTDGVFLEKELERCLRNFNLENDMQVIYCFTPIHGTNTPHDLRMMRWDVMRDEMEKFDEATMRAALFITVKPGLVNKRYLALPPSSHGSI